MRNTLAEIVVGIDGADAAAWRRAEQLLRGSSAEGLPASERRTRGHGVLAAVEQGGSACCPGWKGPQPLAVLRTCHRPGSARMVAAHDCDIETFSREMLARLCYPVAHPDLGFDFCKGFSAASPTGSTGA